MDQHTTTLSATRRSKTDNAGRRLVFWARLEHELAELGAMVRANALTPVTTELAAASLDKIVDIDYNLRQLALSHGITGESRRDYARRKGELLRNAATADARLTCAVCVVKKEMFDCDSCQRFQR